MSLRNRILTTLLLLLAAGLVVADTATYASLELYLAHRTDAQLQTVRQAATRAIALRGPTLPLLRHRQAFPGDLPTWMALRHSDGTLVIFRSDQEIVNGKGRAISPRTPRHFPSLTYAGPTGAGAGSQQPGQVSTVASGQAGGPSWRLSISPLPHNQQLLVGVPLTATDRILHDLALAELVGSLVVIAVALLAARRAIKVSLRPLVAIEGIASDIAGGDLDRRIPELSPRTEIGQLAQALNGMLGQLQAASERQRDVEAKLRRFVADASHELRTPLTAIRGYAELYRRNPHLRAEDLALSLARIEADAARMGVLVKELLSLAELDEGRSTASERVELGAVAHDGVADARVVAPQRRLTLTAADDAWVDGDPGQLRQIVDNLLSNVLTHTPPDTPTSVQVERDDTTVTVRVADTGPGIPAEHTPHVFDRFYRVDVSRSHRNGTSGLGLSIASEIARVHGGRLDYAATPGGGATFVLQIPVAASPPPDEAAGA